MPATTTSDDLIFADEYPMPPPEKSEPWKILVVDDDEDIHRVTRLVLSPFVFRDRPIQILSAHSGLEARSVLSQNPDISVILLDVVMETDDAGLRLVHFIREQYINRKCRIILRTGQPGYAPELKVLLDYDINDYRAKAELTAERLLSAVAVSLRSHMDIDTAEKAIALTQLAQEAAIAKTTFLANMSHELRTPLNAVVGNIELLRMTELTPRQIDIADSAAVAARLLMEVIGDVLDLSKIESDRFEIDSVPCHVDEIINEVRGMMEPEAQAKGLRIRSYISHDVPRHVAADPVRIQQVILNFLANAVKFTAAGSIFLYVHATNRRNGVIVTRFEVVDTGIGFDPAKRETIFEPFIQADNSMSRRYGGSGLGLAISRRIVELLGGTIGVTTEQGLGSTFWFEIPLATVNGEEPPLFPDLVEHTVLFVDDPETEGCLQILEGCYARALLCPDIASCCQLAVEALSRENRKPALVISERRMAEATVDQINDLVRAANPMIVIAGANDSGAIYRAYHRGATCVLIDPARYGELPFLVAAARPASKPNA